MRTLSVLMALFILYPSFLSDGENVLTRQPFLGTDFHIFKRHRKGRRKVNQLRGQSFGLASSGQTRKRGLIGQAW